MAKVWGNFGEVAARLKAMPEKVKSIMASSAKDAMQPMLQAVVQNAPKDSGDLAASAKITVKRKKDKVFCDVTIGKGDFLGPTWYAAVVEFGSVKQPAQSFMRKSFDETAPECLARLRANIVKAVDKIAKKGG